MTRSAPSETSAADERDVAPEDARRLHGVTAGLAGAATTDEIADVVIREGIPALEARTGVLGVVERGSVLRFVRTSGYGDVFPDRLDLDEHWPITDAVRSRRTIELRDLRERRAAYDVPDEIWKASGHGTLVAVPLLIGDRAIGALGFTREETTRLSESERLVVETLASLAAHALDRAALHDAEKRARAAAEALHRVTSAVARAPTMRGVAEAVASEAVAVLDASAVTVILGGAEDGASGEVVASCGTVAEYATREPRVNLGGNTVSAQAIRTQTPIYVDSLDELERRWPASAGVARQQGIAAIACVPIDVEGRLGALSVVFEQSRRFEDAERVFLELLGRICEQGFVRASLYDTEHEIASRLQRALLPATILKHPHMDIAAHYQAASASIVVGGDWYDVFELPEGRVGFAVGDVVGHGVEAAAAMGRLRSALAAYAFHGAAPATVLDRLAAFAAGPGDVPFATACYTIIDAVRGSVACASAGHPPPLVVREDGRTEWLEAGSSVPLPGKTPRKPREGRVRVAVGSTILLYSDGLVERRGESLNAGLARLESAARGLRTLRVEDMCKELLTVLQQPGRRGDDTVLVAVRLTG